MPGWTSISSTASGACGRASASCRAGKMRWRRCCASASTASRWKICRRPPSGSTSRRRARCRSSRSAAASLQSGPAGGRTPLRDYITCTDAGVAAVLTRLAGRRVRRQTMPPPVSPSARSLPAGAMLVCPQGHVFTRSSVSFHAADSEIHGILSRQREIEELRGRREELERDAGGGALDGGGGAGRARARARGAAEAARGGRRGAAAAPRPGARPGAAVGADWSVSSTAGRRSTASWKRSVAQIERESAARSRAGLRLDELAVRLREAASAARQRARRPYGGRRDSGGAARERAGGRRAGCRRPSSTTARHRSASSTPRTASARCERRSSAWTASLQACARSSPAWTKRPCRRSSGRRWSCACSASRRLNAGAPGARGSRARRSRKPSSSAWRASRSSRRCASAPASCA